eukprot:COSAG05_NODE_2308_length_3247_cov_3.259530_1_plen_265_part_00
MSSPVGRAPPDLRQLTMRELKTRARALGADEEAIDSLDDADDSKAAAIGLVQKLTDRAAPATTTPTSLRAELEGLKMRELKKRARDLGADEAAIDCLDDAPNVKAAAVELVLKLTPTGPDEDKIRAELHGRSLRELKKMARILDVDENDIDALDDADDVTAAAVELVVRLTVAKDLTPEGVPKLHTVKRGAAASIDSLEPKPEATPLQLQKTPPTKRAPSKRPSKKRAFGSMRFDGVVPPHAEQLRQAMLDEGDAELEIINMVS